jgi:hypothetical protein
MFFRFLYILKDFLINLESEGKKNSENYRLIFWTEMAFMEISIKYIVNAYVLYDYDY